MLGNQGTFLCCVDSRLGSFGGHLAHGLISDAVLGWLYIGRGVAAAAGPRRLQSWTKLRSKFGLIGARA